MSEGKEVGGALEESSRTITGKRAKGNERAREIKLLGIYLASPPHLNDVCPWSAVAFLGHGLELLLLW